MIRISDSENHTIDYVFTFEEATDLLFSLGYFFIDHDHWVYQGDKIWQQYQFFLEEIAE